MLLGSREARKLSSIPAFQLSSRQAWWRELVLVLLVAVPFIFWGLGSVSLLDPDEGMYGSIAREMAEKGDWITPHFDGVRYLEKPPLYFWLTAMTFTLFGPSELGTRLWSALPTLGTTILTWRIGRLLYGGRAGLLAAIVLVTSVGVFRYTRVAATDSLLVFSLTLAMYGFVIMAGKLESQEAGKLSCPGSKVQSRTLNVGHWTSNIWPFSLLAFKLGPLLFWLGCALGVLCKGLIGLVLPLLIVGLYGLASGEWRMANREWQIANGERSRLFAIGYSLLANPVGWLLFLGLTVPWHLLAAWKNPGFLAFYFVDNQVFRFLSSRAFIEDDIPLGAIAFLALTWIWFFPWSLFLLSGLRQGFPSPGLTAVPQERLRLVVGLWALTVIGFFSFSSSTLEHYALPALPALSLMVGTVWAEAFASSVVNDPSSMVRRQVRGLKWLLALSAAGCGIVGVALALWADSLTPEAVFTWLAKLNVYYRILREQGMPFPFSSVAPFVPLARGLGLVLAVGLPLAFALFLLKRPRASFAAVTAVGAGIGALILELLLVIEPHHSAKSVALALKAQARKDDIIVHEGSLEYSGGLPFYTGRRIYVLNGQRGDLDFGSRYPEGQGLFLDENGLTRLWDGKKRVFLVTRQTGQKRDLSKQPGRPLFFLGQYGSRFLYSNHGP